jgi:ABC-type multidrug transport system fused ATPase/permease subunit
MNEPLTFYTSRIADLKRALSQINKKEIVLSYSRLASFIAALLSFALLFTFSAVAATVTGVIFLILFAWLVKYHNNVIGDRTFHEHLIKVNEAEAAALEGDYSSLPDGSEYIKAYRDHYYSFDLDIFGGNSLYRLVNRTSTKPGSDLMAEWLTEPAGVEEVRERQEAVSDMRERIEWRQKLQVAGSMHRDSGRDPSEIIRWTRSSETFKSNGFLKLAINALSILVMASLVLQFFGLPLAVTVLLLTVNFMVNFIFQKRINDMHAKVSRSSDMLNSYASVISLIEKENFISRKLVGLQDNLRTGGAASKQIKDLSQLVRNLDVRLNVLVSVFLNLFWFWDIRMCYRMEAWKGKNTPFIHGWFDVMAEMEALASFANLSFNNAEWVMPTVREGNFHLDAVEAGHPLIPRLKRVSNDLKITGPGKLLLITGSNMSGKSTFLRTIGVNLVLAYAGSVVCATSLRPGR